MDVVELRVSCTLPFSNSVNLCCVSFWTVYIILDSSYRASLLLADSVHDEIYAQKIFD